jgi:hypothetical protein
LNKQVWNDITRTLIHSHNGKKYYLTLSILNKLTKKLYPYLFYRIWYRLDKWVKWYIDTPILDGRNLLEKNDVCQLWEEMEIMKEEERQSRKKTGNDIILLDWLSSVGIFINILDLMGKYEISEF